MSKLILFVARKVEQNIGASLTDDENLHIIKLTKSFKKNGITDINAIITYITHKIKTKLLHDVDLLKDIDMLATLKEESEPEVKLHPYALPEKINTFFGINDMLYIRRILAPKSLYKYAYVLLDTNNKDANLSSETTFGWNFMPNALLQSGTVNTIGKIQDLVGMRVFPIKANLDATSTPVFPYSWPPAGHTEYTTERYYNNFVNTNNNFTILIEEFKAQSFVGRDGRRFHFVFFPAVMNLLYQFRTTIVPANPYIEYTTSGKGNGWFWFRTPITSFSTLTINMADPFNPITLSKNVRTLIPIELIYLSDVDETL